MRQILLFAALAASLALLAGCTLSKTKKDAPGKAAYHKLSAEEAYEMMVSQEVVGVDVRTREAYDGGHIARLQKTGTILILVFHYTHIHPVVNSYGGLTLKKG